MLRKSIQIIFLLTFSVFAQQQNDFNNRYILAQSFMQAGQYEKAKIIFEELYNIQPQNYQVFTGLNNSYTQLKEYDSSIKIIENRINTTPQDINLYGMLGSTYYLMGNENKAFEVWYSAVDKIPNKDITYRILANYAIERRAFEKAIDYLQKGKSSSGDPKYFSFDLGNLYALTMQFTKATEEYCTILSSDPQQLPTIQSRILLYINKPNALEQTLKVVEDWDKNRDISFLYLLADLYKEAKEYSKAYDLYLNIEKIQNKKGFDIINFANYLLNEKQYDLAVKAFSKIIEKFSDSPFTSNAKLGYAKTLEASLENDSALTALSWKPYSLPVNINSDKFQNVINAFSEIIKLYPGSEVANESLLRIGNLYLNSMNDLSEAEKYFNKIISYIPGSGFSNDAYLGLGEVQIIQDKLDDATITVSKILARPGTPPEKINAAKYKLAVINFYNGNFDNAKEILSEITDSPEDNNANDALELSLILNVAKNDSVNLAKFANAELLTKQTRFKDALKIYSDLAGIPRAFIINGISEFREAEIDLALDSLQIAVEKLGKIAEKQEKNIYADKALYLQALTFEFGIKDIQKALKSYEKLLARFPNSVYLDAARKAINTLKNKIS